MNTPACAFLKTPPKTKAQLKVELAKVGARHEHYVGDYTADIEVWNPQNTAKALLNCIAPKGSDPLGAMRFSNALAVS